MLFMNQIDHYQGYMDKNVVFLPGTLTDSRIWINQQSLFLNSIIVNLRNQISIQEMLDDIYKIQYAKFHLIGFSMGGYIAQEFTIKYPHRVESLTIIGASAFGYPEEEYELALRNLFHINSKSFKGITEKRLQLYLHPKSYFNEEIKQLVKDMQGADAAEVYLRQTKATLNRRPLVKELTELGCRIQFIAGKNDHIVKLKKIKSSHHAIPESKIHIIDECGHFIPLERPAELNLILSSTI